MKITAKSIASENLGFGQKERIIYDEDIPGFGLRIRQGGSRVLVFTYKYGGMTRRMTLAKALPESFAVVRKKAAELHHKVKLGEDPAQERDDKRQKALQDAKDNFKTIADRFLAQYPDTVKKNGQKIRAKTVTEVKRYLTVLAKPLHGSPVVSISKRDIATLLSAVAASSGDVSANRLQSALSTMFKWVEGEGLIQENPVLGTNSRGESERDRVLSDDELVGIWRAADDSSIAGDIIKLLMLTGQRRNEIAGLRWDEIDDNMMRITLPKHRTKNGLEHVVPLSEPARGILTHRHRIAGQDGVFSSGDAYRSMGQYKQVLDKRLLAARTEAFQQPLLPWVLHDLRRSVATRMADLKVLPHVIEALLNHISGHKAGVAGIYNKSTYYSEKVAALELWSQHLMAAIHGTPAKVVPLRA